MASSDIERLLSGFAWSGDRSTAMQASSGTREVGGIEIPADLLELLVHHGGGEGPVGGRARLRLWPLVDWVRINETLEAHVNWPGVVLFGEDGGGGFFGLDDGGTTYVRVEGIGTRNRERLGASLHEFLTNLASPEG